MWLFASKGFLSIVAHRHKPEYLLVRARKMSHLKALFPNADHYYDPGADYPHRAEIHRSIVANMALDYIMNLKYCLLYTSPSPRDQRGYRMPSSA